MSDPNKDFQNFIQNYTKKGSDLLKEDLKDDIKDPHLFMVFQIDETNMSQIHICEDIQEVKRRRDLYVKEKYFRGEPACEGGDLIGKGEFSYIPIFPDKSNRNTI
jgi:hypothetical protein